MSKEITRDEIKAKLERNEALILVEALAEPYYRAGHLPGALLMPHDRVRELAGQVVPDKSAEVVVYCASATCRNSHIAAAQLELLGYQKVRVYAGGKADWQEGGLALQS